MSFNVECYRQCMNLEHKNYNQAVPHVMHIDLNSCFATVEQQARPLLRGRPVAVVNRRSEHTMIVTASYEAKARGVGLGMTLKEAKKLCPDLVGVESDPSKYRYVYKQLMRIMSDYSSHVRMKSIDEGVIDFSEACLRGASEQDLVGIGYEIKSRLRNEIGCWMRCNVGIGANRFLAKTAAGLHKPDGLDVINSKNLLTTFEKLELEDLTGIARRNRHRLEAVGIKTPVDFLQADLRTLSQVVFKGVPGVQWHHRLRGWEVDKLDFPIRTAGRQYVLEAYAVPENLVLERLHHLCESVGRKVRGQGLVARGVGVHARSYKQGYWHNKRMMAAPFFSDAAIYSLAKELFKTAPYPLKEIGIHCYGLSAPNDRQLVLFGDELAKISSATRAVDEINQRYGDRTVHSAHTIKTDMVKQKVPFGSTRYF